MRVHLSKCCVSVLQVRLYVTRPLFVNLYKNNSQIWFQNLECICIYLKYIICMSMLLQCVIDCVKFIEFLLVVD